MSERENNEQHQKLKTRLLAIASVLVCILGIIIIVLKIAFYRPWWSEYVARNAVGLLGIIGLVLGFIALRKIPKRLGIIKLKGNICAILGRDLGVLLVGCWFLETFGSVGSVPKDLAICAYNLQQLSKAILLYSNDNQGRYPEPNRWCDLLLEYEQIELKHFLCPDVTFQWHRQVFPWPVPKNEKCYYAMNPNCEPNLPPDTVLLFETKGGWNRFGGPELLTTENHLGRSNILFNDGRVERVGQKHIPDLNWGDEQKKL